MTVSPFALQTRRHDCSNRKGQSRRVPRDRLAIKPWQEFIDLPTKCIGSLQDDGCQILVAVVPEAKRQSHSIPKRLEQIVFVGCADSRTVKSLSGKLCGEPPLLPPRTIFCLSNAKIQSSLVRLAKFMSFIDVDDIVVLGTKQQCVEI